MKASPGPWRWDVEAHSSNVLRAADGDTIALYDMPYSRARGEMDVANRALIAAAPDMASMLRELEWRGQATGFLDCCPCCGGIRAILIARSEGLEPGHKPDCRLAKLLSELPE